MTSDPSNKLNYSLIFHFLFSSTYIFLGFSNSLARSTSLRSWRIKGEGEGGGGGGEIGRKKERAEGDWGVPFLPATQAKSAISRFLFTDFFLLKNGSAK